MGGFLARDCCLQLPRTKIVCTIGPSSSEYEVIKKLIQSGMNVARLNFSHGTQQDHRNTLNTLRRASRETGRVLGIMLDLQGPKVRVGLFASGSAQLKSDAHFTITTRPVEGNDSIVSTTYARLHEDVGAGDTILLDDGMIALEVTEVAKQDIHCRVVTEGELKNNKGINVPGARLSVETITEKDYRDVEFALEAGVDFLAMSFVRHPDDLKMMREFLKGRGASLPIISKIEKPQALEHIDEIIEVSDGIMVARGDLGVEIPAEEVPHIQKMIIKKCNRVGKPVITATQMLESMIHNPRPTRAEASDVANAILDGSDAVMLSGESAMGKYPVEAVTTMKRIIHATEASHLQEQGTPIILTQDDSQPIQEGISASACILARQVNARAIASITLRGAMARVLSKHRPVTPIFAISQSEESLRQLSLYWGVEGIHSRDMTSAFDEAVPEVVAMLVEHKVLTQGDRCVITAGLPFHGRQVTNTVRVEFVE